MQTDVKEKGFCRSAVCGLEMRVWATLVALVVFMVVSFSLFHWAMATHLEFVRAAKAADEVRYAAARQAHLRAVISLCVWLALVAVAWLAHWLRKRLRGNRKTNGEGCE